MFALRQLLTLSLLGGLRGGGVAIAAKVTTRGAKKTKAGKVAAKVTTLRAKTKVAKVAKVAEELKKVGWVKGAKKAEKDAKDLLEINEWDLDATLEFVTSKPSSSASSSSSSSGASGSASAPDQEAGAGATFGSGLWRLVENNAAGACLFESLNDQLAHASGTREQFFTVAQKRELDTAGGIAVYGQQLREEAVQWMRDADPDWWVQRLGSIERPEEEAICMFLADSLYFPQAKDGDPEQLAGRKEYVAHQCKSDQFTKEIVLDYMKGFTAFGDDHELRVVSALRNVRAQVWHTTEAGEKKLNDLKCAAKDTTGAGRLAGVSFWMDEADFVRGVTDDQHADGLVNEASVVEVHVLHLRGHWMSIHPPTDWLLSQSALADIERQDKEESLQVAEAAGAHGEAHVRVADGGSGAASLFTALVHQGIHSRHNSLFQKKVREQLADPALAATKAEAMRSDVEIKLRSRDDEWWATKLLTLLLHWQEHEDEARSFCDFAASDSVRHQAANRRSRNVNVAINRFTKNCVTQIAHAGGEEADLPSFVTRELVQKYLLSDHGVPHALPLVLEYLNLQRANVWRLNEEGQVLLTAYREEEDNSEGGNAGTAYPLQRKHLVADPDVYSPDTANVRNLDGHVNLLRVDDAYMSVLF
eukprot:g5650.t1